MILHKGHLYFYSATGEQPHFYVWTSESDVDHHIMINETDIVEFTDEKKRIKHVILSFPSDMEGLRDKLSKKDYNLFFLAAKNNWAVEVVKFEV